MNVIMSMTILIDGMLFFFFFLSYFCFSFIYVKILGEDLAAMLRRNIRLRREYLYRKSLEGKERLLYEKKRKIREALEGIPSLCLIVSYLPT